MPGEKPGSDEEHWGNTDLGQLTTAQRAKLVVDVLESNDQDNERFMQKLRERMDSLGLVFPSAEVRFENINAEAAVFMGTRALPSLSNTVLNAFGSVLQFLRLQPESRRPLHILHDVSSVLKPGRLTLLLGPPGAGKSTLMKILAGTPDKNLKCSGTVTYNGHTFKEFIPERTAVYVPQNDNHIGEMTVRETLDFSSRVQGPGYRAEIARALEQHKSGATDDALETFLKAAALEGNPSNVFTDYILKIMGLNVCSETMLGNAMIRGVSGGQKKRVTTGELIVGPKHVLLMDEISTGLDSATTYLITKCMRDFARYTDATVLIALLQPAPETYDLFDDILLLSEGTVVYHGPREEVVPFFEHMGFKCPERKGVADFLQEVTSVKDQQQYWVKNENYYYVSIEQFADEFKDTGPGKAIQATLSTPYPREESPPGALQTQRYGLSSWEMLKATFAREFLLMKRNLILYVAYTINLFLMAIMLSTLFFRTTLHINVNDANFYLAALFFGLMLVMFNGFAELTLLIMRLPVFFKQRDQYLYPAWAWVLPMAILAMPFSIWAAILYSGVTYYIIGFAPEAGRFFYQILLFFTVHQMSVGMFRMIGAICRSEIIANTFGALSLGVVFVLGGFIVAKEDIPVYWVWGFWSSPLAYAQNGLSVNEFLAPRWKTPAMNGMPTGLVLLYSRSLFSQSYWRWLGVGTQVGFVILFNAIIILVLSFFDPLGSPQPLLSEEIIEARHAARTGEGVSAPKEMGRQLTRTSSTKPNLQRMESNREALMQFRNSIPRGKDVEVGNTERGMLLPFNPLALSFHNVNYYVDMPAAMKAEGAEGNRLQLLKGISGAFRPKVLTALVGVSGAGKTTLMDVLAGRKTGGYIEGDVRVSGYPKVHETFARVSGYCEQNDIHTPQVTVYESLLYSAWLRLPEDVTQEAREGFVEEVMSLVELDTLRDALVGLPGVNGLSTEQRKRLTIAVELVANPSIIFMDEPTSGLDARAAAIVMRAVRNTVDTGRTVVCTIHQPSIDIFEAFDELLLMKRGGQVIYMGPLGTNSQILVDYFQAIPGVPPIKDGYNPATWMLEVSHPAAAEKLGIDFAEAFRASEQFRRNEELIEQLKTPPEGHQDLFFPSQYSTSYYTQFQANLWKRSCMYWRAPDYNIIRYVFTTILGLLVGSVFWNFGSKRSTQQSLLNVLGALYTTTLFMGFSNSTSVQPIISVERPVFYRERAAGYYGAIPYALAQGVIELPYVIIQTVLYTGITYSMIHFEWTAAKFFWFLLFMFLTLIYFTYYGMMAISITPDAQLAMVASSFFFSTWNMMSGFLIPAPSMHWWWRWSYYISPIAWSLYGFIASQLGDVTTPLYVPALYPYQPTVQEYLAKYYLFYKSNLGYIVLILVGFVFGFFFIFAWALRNINFQKR